MGNVCGGMKSRWDREQTTHSRAMPCVHGLFTQALYRRSQLSTQMCSQLSTPALTIMRSSNPFPVGGERGGVTTRVEVEQSVRGVERQVCRQVDCV